MFVEFLGHVIGESDASVGGCVAREVAGVHADRFVKSQEIGHGSWLVIFSGSWFVFTDVCVVIDDLVRAFSFDDSVE